MTQITIMTHEVVMEKKGFDICSPVSGSMKPMIRPRRDSVLFVPLTGRAGKYDVVLYRQGEKCIMHRVIGVVPGGYIIRGDNSYDKEHVPEHQLIGVMQGFYRDERFIEKDDWLYRLYACLWPRLHFLLMLYKKVRMLQVRICRAVRRRLGKGRN